MAAPGTHPNPDLGNTANKPDRWRRVESLFHAASDVAEADRAGFLANSCGNDTELLHEVESLLASADKTLGFLQQPVQRAAQDVAVQNAGVQRIGPYELIRLIGSGGMGDVYLAERVDEQFRRRVAIKLMRSGLEQSQILKPRFRAERQILANLDHPSIARLLDGGITPEGLPYLVMEYVEGLPIDEFCAHNKLGVKQRLKLFQGLCSAVEYAHRHFVVHRDIKPQNVLVTSEGVPKLLDFGIAKLLDPEERSMEPTRQTQRLMTPEYASPEQLLGKSITTASDVYGLGVLLYELLVGRRPFRARTGTPGEIAAIICEQEPKTPLLAAKENPGLAAQDLRAWRPELDSIVLKAIAKNPAARYDSAAQMASDISAYFNGYPLLSGPGTWRYRTGKWIGRHKSSAAIAVVAVIASIVMITMMASSARRAQEDRLKAERVAKFLVDMFTAAAPEASKGRTISARDLLDQGAKRIDKELSSIPSVHASMLDTIAEAYSGLGLYDEGRGLAERSYQLRLKTLGRANPETADSLYLVADLVRKQGDYAKAEHLLQEVVTLRAKTVGENSLDYAGSLGALSECLYMEGKDAEAEPMLRRALAIDRRHGPDYGDEVRNYLALVLERRGDYNEAGSLLQEAVDIDRRVKGVDSPDFAISLHNLASALIDQGDLNGAEARLRETLAIRRRVLGNEHPMLSYTLNNLGFVLLEKGQPDAAEPFLREAMEVNARRLGPNHPQLVAALNNWGRLQQAKGRFPEASKYYERGLGILRSNNMFTSWASSQILLNMGLLEFDQGHYAAAETWAHQSLEMKRKLGGENSLTLDSALIDLADDLLFQGDARGAEPLLREALAQREKKYSAQHPAVVAAQVRLGETLIAEGKELEADSVLRQGLLAARTAPFPLLNWQVAEAESALAACLLAEHRIEEAQPLSRASQAGLLEHPRPAFRKPASDRLLRLNAEAHKSGDRLGIH